MKKKDIYILGVGNNTAVYIDLVVSCGYNPAALYHYNDKRIGEEIHCVPIVDSNNNLFKKDSLEGINFAVSVGDNRIRATLANSIRERGGTIPTLIHPTATVSKYANLDSGVVIHANSVVQADSWIGQDSVISYNAGVTHTSRICKACYLAAGANLGAYVTVNDYVLIGQAAVIVSGKLEYIGSNALVGAGSVVVNNVEPYCVVAGNPAKVIKILKS